MQFLDPIVTTAHHHPPVIAIFGPTGVGKTGASIELSLKFNGEIVNTDSRYMYRHLQTGVAKPTLEERKGVRHHLLDLFDLGHVITLAEIKSLAYAAIDDIHQRGVLPILVGGSPLYMNAITEGWSMPEVEPDWDFRREAEERVASEGLEWLDKEVRAIDPTVAERSSGNARRLIRALEIWRATGKPMSELESRIPPPYRVLPIALTRPRDVHYADLDLRIDKQVADGFLDEVRSLLEMGFTGHEPAFTAIGYRELVEVVRGSLALDEAVAKIRHANHRYVRHQMTWLRRRKDLIWFDTSVTGWYVELETTVRTFLDQTGTYDP
jgi:tRNA dimethylallyltransferase